MQAKTLLPAACALLVTVASAPGALGVPLPGDAITRTFDALVLAQVEFLPPGLGLQSPLSPCPATLLGTTTLGASDVVYYQSGRVATNLKTGSIVVLGPPPIPVLPGPCPVPGSGPGTPLLLVIPDLNLHGPHEAVAIDQLLCIEGNAGLPVDCFPDPATAVATVSRCNKDDAFFLPAPVPPDGRSALADLLGSRGIGCIDLPLDPTDGFQDTVTYYDGAAGGPTGPVPYCEDFFFADGGWGADCIQVEDTVPLGNGLDDTGYLVTCMSVIAVVIDLNKPPVVPAFLPYDSHDYKLILDLDGTPGNWGDALLIHAAFGLQGWHDLGGLNGFPCPAGAVQPDKKGDFPLTPTPLSPK